MYGDRMNGCGGFVDISQTVKRIVFSGTMVVGSQSTCSNNELVIARRRITLRVLNSINGSSILLILYSPDKAGS